eukprot:gene1339-15738_t
MLITLFVTSRTPTSRWIEVQQTVALARTTSAAAVPIFISPTSWTKQGLRLDVSIDGKVYYSKEVSVKNPPPICFQVPVLKSLASICLEFYNLSWREHVGGCLRLKFKMLFVFGKSFKIGCFHFNNLDAESKAGVAAILRDLHRLQQSRRSGTPDLDYIRFA